MLDCGEATQLQLMKVQGRPHRLDAILISHLHPDHYLGLMGLLSTLTLRGRTRALSISGPEGLEDIIETQRRASRMEFPFVLRYHILEPGAPRLAWENHRMRITTFDLEHRIPCFGFKVEEKVDPHPLDKKQLARVTLPVAAMRNLKEGRDYTDDRGRVYRATDFLLPPHAPRTYIYATDTRCLPERIPDFEACDLMYHEATYLHELAQKAHDTYHTTAVQAAQLARDAGVARLLLGHFSARYTHLQPFLEEARPIFPETYLAEETLTFTIPRAGELPIPAPSEA